MSRHVSSAPGACLRAPLAGALALLLCSLLSGRASAQEPAAQVPPPPPGAIDGGGTDAPGPSAPVDDTRAPSGPDAGSADGASAASVPTPQEQPVSTGAGGQLGTPTEDLPSSLFGEEGPVEEVRTPVGRDLVQEDEAVSSSPRTMLGRLGAVWMDLGVSAGGPSGGSANGNAVAISSELGLRYRVTNDIVADASFGFTYSSTQVHGETTIETMSTPYAGSYKRLDPGNPTFGGSYVYRSEGLFLQVGVSMAIPTAARNEPGTTTEGVALRASSQLAFRAAQAMRGYRGAWHWAPERFSFAVPFRMVIPMAPLTLELNGAVATMIPVLGDRTSAVDTIFELGVGAGATVVGPLSIGARIGGVGAASGTTVPPFTLSVQPWVRLRFDPVQITARVTMNVAGTDRIGSNQGPSFGAFLGAGASF